MVRRAVFTTLFLCFCSGPFVLSEKEGRNQGASVSAVLGFVNGFGQKSGSKLISLFTPDATVEVKGIGVIAQGKRGLLDFFGYAQAVGSRLNGFDFQIKEETVFCRLSERNELYEILDLGQVSYDAWFVFQRRRVLRLVIQPETGTNLIFFGQALGFLNWLKGNEPNAVNELMPDGRFRFSAENGRRLLKLAERWRSQRR
ncbi:MAG: hypothetical protein ABIK49_00785 [candidate division WOR-3 bacterium]